MKILFVIAAILLEAPVLAQEFNEKWLDIRFESREDYTSYEDEILACSKYILSVPMNDFNRQSALTPVAQWMSGTPDYTFIIGPKLEKLTESNEFVLSLYMAASVQYALENKGKKFVPEDVELAAYDKMLQYIENRDYKFRITKEIDRAIKARRNGKLAAYIGK